MYSKRFSIEEDLLRSSRVQFSFILPKTTSELNKIKKSNYQVILKNLNGRSSMYLFPPDATRELDLNPGEYRLDVISSNSGGVDEDEALIASITWSKKVYELPKGEWYGGGKRVKKIEWLEESKVLKTTEYEYKNVDGTSSGKMHALPDFYFITNFSSGSSIPVIDKYGSRPGSPLTQIQGNSVGYSRITEYLGSREANTGKTVYTFTDFPDGGRYWEFPYYLPTDMEWLRGKPISIEMFEKIDSTYKLKRRTQYSYSYGGRTSPAIFTTPFLHRDSLYVYRKDRRLLYLPFLVIKDEMLNFKTYYQTAGASDIESIQETLYDDHTQ